MQMERPISIDMPAPWCSMHSDFDSAYSDSNSPTPTSENPTASFGSFGFPNFQKDFVHLDGQQNHPEHQFEEDEEVAWSATSLKSSFSSQGRHATPFSDMYAPSVYEEEAEPVAPLPSKWPPVASMQRSSSCRYDARSSAPSRLLSGTSGGASMVRSYSNPMPSLVSSKAGQAALEQEALNIQDKEQWSPSKRSASTTYDLPTLSSSKESPVKASSLYNNPYHPDRILHPQPQSNNSSPHRPRLGRFLSFEPSSFAREQATLY